MSKQIIVDAKPLPSTNKKLILKGKSPVLNTLVKTAIMNGAYERLVPYLQSVNASKGVTGSVKMDRAMAAFELQKWGADTGNEIISRANLTDLDRAINVALRSIEEDGRPIDRRSRRLAALAAPSFGNSGE
jgi:hypothetical protein